LKGRFQIFEKPLRTAGEDLPFSIRLIASICVIHNFLIDARDTVPEEDILQAAACNSGISDDDIEEDNMERNNEGVTREAFICRSRWLDEA